MVFCGVFSWEVLSGRGIAQTDQNLLQYCLCVGFALAPLNLQKLETLAMHREST